MTRFLAIIRRIFGAGTLSLLFTVILGSNFSHIWQLAKQHNSVECFFAIFFLISPILFLVFTVVSVIYIRHHGAFRYVHQSQSPVVSFFRCIGHDLVAPFKNIKNFFLAIFSKHVSGRGLLICRFLEMTVLLFICLVGVGAVLSTL